VCARGHIGTIEYSEHERCKWLLDSFRLWPFIRAKGEVRWRVECDNACGGVRVCLVCDKEKGIATFYGSFWLAHS
jgi:hypothetical protein